MQFKEKREKKEEEKNRAREIQETMNHTKIHIIGDLEEKQEKMTKKRTVRAGEINSNLQIQEVQ